MSLDTVAKVTVSIGPATRCTTEAEFKALSDWTAISNIKDVGEMKGDKPIAVGKYVDQDYVRKLAGGPRDPGDQTMVFGYDPDDEGQIALKAADLANEAYAFKIELPDAPSGGTPTTWYFMCIIGPVSLSFGDGSDPIELTAVLNIDGKPVEVGASPPITFSPVAGALTGGTASTAYTVTIAATGGTGTVSYAVTTGTLPDGLSLDTATGEISGTPTEAGTSNFTITATFTGSGQASAAYSIVVSA